MISYGSSVTIARPPDEVFPYLTERDKQAQWSDVPMQPLTEGPLGQGSRFRITFGQAPLRTSVDLEIAGLEPNRRFAWTTVSGGPVHWEGEYRLEPSADGGTRLSQQGTLRFGGLWRLVEPIVGAEIKRNELAELERLKSVVEGTKGQ